MISILGYLHFSLSEVKYLGHVITADLRDDKDNERQRRVLYAQGNMLVRKFYMCSEDVKTQLFRTFCTPMYIAQLWWNYSNSSSSMRKLKVAYNDVMRMLLGLPRFQSAIVKCLCAVGFVIVRPQLGTYL